MRKVICIFLVIGLYSLLSAQYQVYNQSTSERSKFGIYAAEFGGALLGTTGCIGCALGSVLLLGPIITAESGVYASATTFIIYLTAVPISTAYGVTFVGKKLNQNRSYWSSLLGAYSGMLLGFGICAFSVGEKFNDSDMIAIAVSSLLGNALGAVVGYNLSRPKTTTSQGSLNHFEPPSLGIRPEKTDDGKTITAFDFRLINARL